MPDFRPKPKPNLAQILEWFDEVIKNNNPELPERKEVTVQLFLKRVSSYLAYPKVPITASMMTLIGDTTNSYIDVKAETPGLLSLQSRAESVAVLLNQLSEAEVRMIQG